MTNLLPVKKLSLALLVLILVAALLLSPTRAPLAAQEPAIPNSSEQESKLVQYVVEVLDKVQKYHPDGKKLSAAQLVDGAKKGVLQAVRNKPDLPADQKETLVEFLKSKTFRSITQLMHVLDRFSREYTKLNMDAVADAAAQGVLKATQDQFCRVLTFQEIQRMQQMMMQSEDKSIGAVPSPIDPDAETLRLKVGHIRRGYLAHTMGLRQDDEILAINGRNLADVPREQINEQFEANQGATVTITIRRAGFDKPITLSGVQRITTHPAARGVMLPGKIGYIDTNMFTMDLHGVVRRELKRLLDQGMVALILDLRNNPGGAMPACTELADDFLPKGALITTTKGSYENPLAPLAQFFGAGDGGRRIDADTTAYEDKRDNPHTFPLIVLINGMSASASEMLSGCWKSHKRATLVGETTYGKGIGQTAIPLDNGPAGRTGGIMGMMGGNQNNVRFLYMTVMTYFLPHGEPVHHVGVAPDIPVKLADPDAKLFDKLAALRQTGELTKYIDANFEAHKAFFVAQLTGKPAKLAEYPAAETLRKSTALKAFSPETIERELRLAILVKLGSAAAVNLADDNQLQVAILEACKKANVDVSTIDEYRFFAK